MRNKSNVFKTGFLELKKVWQQVKHLPVLKRFLYSFFWYSAGIQTVFLASAQFGAKELHLPTTKLIITIMIIQLVAIPGAIFISRLSEKVGNIKTLIGVVSVWVLLCIGGYFIKTDIQFYILGALVGLVMGGIQSLSRSTYANLMPKTNDTASFFSFYDVTEKIALVLGMFSFAYVEELTGSMRNSVLALVLFFFLGFHFSDMDSSAPKKISPLKIEVLNTGYFKLDGGAMFGVVPKSMWNKLNPADENNLCNWALRCMLIEDDNRLILVDTGMGDKQDEKFFNHYYPLRNQKHQRASCRKRIQQ